MPTNSQQGQSLIADILKRAAGQTSIGQAVGNAAQSVQRAGSFDVEGARQAGYSDAEINTHLSQSQKPKSFDVAGAKAAGYSDAEINDHLFKNPFLKAINTPVVAQRSGSKLQGLTTGALDVGIGAGKGALSTVHNTSSLLDKLSPTAYLMEKMGLGRPEDNLPDVIPENFRTPTNTAQKIGFGAEQIGEFFVPTGAVAKAGRAIEAGVQGAKYVPKLLKGTTSLVGRAGVEAATAGGITALQEGKLDGSAKTAAAIGGAVPVLGSILSKAVNSEKLISKAMGLTPAQKTKLSQVAKSGGYKGVEDFALQKGLSGSREAMADQVDNLFNEVTGSKAELFQGIKEKVPNQYKNAFDYLRQTYSVPGQESTLAKINQLSKKSQLAASELDDVRYLIDKSLPSRAYSGAEPVKIEGIQNLVDPIRKTLAGLDKTGALKKINTDIRVLYDLLPALGQSANRSVVNQLLFRNIGRTVATGGLGFASGPLGIAGGIASGVGALTDIPQVSSGLAKILQKGRQKLPNITQRVFGG